VFFPSLNELEQVKGHLLRQLEWLMQDLLNGQVRVNSRKGEKL
jgi:hypothetical protein